MIRKTLLSSLLLAPCSLVFANSIIDDHQQALMASSLYNESCYINPALSSDTQEMSNCADYWLLNLSDLPTEERNQFTGTHLGLGISAPFVLVNQPLSNDQRIITALGSFNSELIVDLIDKDAESSQKAQSQISEVKTNSRSRRSASTISGPETHSSSQPTTYSWKFRQVFNLNQAFYPTKDDVAILEYEVEAFSRLPIYDEQGSSNINNPKYIRATLVGGTGINFNPSKRYSYKSISAGYPSHQRMYFSYREYLNRVKITTQWKGAQATILDSFPKNNDRDRSGLTYNSSVNFGLGISIPKLPVNKIDFSSTKSLSFENGNFFDYTAETARNQHSVLYKNKEYGSDYNRDTGYCDLIGNASGCWKYTDTHRVGPPMESFDLLDNTPYSNGYVPDYSVTYQVNRDTTGKSVFQISTQIQGLSLQGFSKWYIGNLVWGGVRGAFDGDDYTLNTYTKTLSLNVDWDSPVFSGVEPSVITAAYGSDEIPQCLTVANNNSVAISACIPNTEEQLFIYNPDRQMTLTGNNGLCLDSSEDVLGLKPCLPYSNNNQSWYWAINQYGESSSDNAIFYTRTSQGQYKILNPAASGADAINILTTDSLEEAMTTMPDAKFNTRKGRYKNTAIVNIQ